MTAHRRENAPAARLRPRPRAPARAPANRPSRATAPKLPVGSGGAEGAGHDGKPDGGDVGGAPSH